MSDREAVKVSRNALCPCGSGKKFKFCHGGSNKPLSPTTNLSSTTYSAELKRTVSVTKDFLVNQIARDGPLIAKSFDRLAMDDIRAMSEVIAGSMSLIFRYMLVDGDTYKPTCARLLSSAVTSFMASIEVARHGFRRPYGAIARHIMEGLATVLHIAVKPEALKLFHSEKLQSTKSITVANKVLPPFGQMYGMLSRHFVHIHRAHSGLEPLIEYEKGEEPLEFIISSLRTNAWLIYVVAELVFYGDIATHRYWRYLGQGAFAYAPSDDERAWLKQFLTPKG
jgi:hypothetical protein